ncbi:MAG TPA: hypothetical protein VGL51_09795 [Solirubrobacteraceae bacterium]|jgi:hypothetical protein
MAVIVRVLDGYRAWSKMTGLPDEAMLIEELRRREGLRRPRSDALEAMFVDLVEAQGTIDNRADAIGKLTAFLGAGLTALGKLDGRVLIKILSWLVVCASGGGLGFALLASSHSAHRTTLLLPASENDLKQSCIELRQNQRLLAAATLFALAAGTLALLAVFASII